ncbi:MAG TPA: DUF5047 domain-containing protein [Spirillospora sp.]|nr:DUF5047 domain-containing protein [Spirillospora sp.]
MFTDYPSLANRLDMLRTGGGTVYGYVEAWYAGSAITVDDEDGRPTTRLPLHADGSNQVSVDGSAPGPRRSLSCTLAPLPGLFDALARTGVELRAYTALEYLDGSVDVEPQGRFDVDVAQVSYAPGGAIQLTAPDRWQRIVKARFFTPRASTKNATARSQIASLITEVVGVTVSDEATSTATVPAQTWDQDRAQAIQDLAKAASLDVFFDRNGIPVMRDVPVLDVPGSVLTIDASETGILIDANRERNRQKTYNIVVVTGAAADGTSPFAPQYVWDTNALSPTYAGPGTGAGSLPPPPSSDGSYQQVPYFYPSPLLRNTTQAQAAGRTILARVTALEAQLTLTSVPAPMLDDGDTITALLPGDDALSAGVTEWHLVDGFTVPLVPHKDPMPITTRSTRPDDTSGG